MISLKKQLPWAIRLIIFVLFMLSGIAKMFPIWAFEKQIVDLGLASWCVSSYLARLIIGLEIAIAIAILQPHFLKRIIIPTTIALLLAFCIHLCIEMVKHGAMNGNCGCFGQLLPMTPLEAFVKNILTIGLLVYLYRHVKDPKKAQNNINVLLLIYSLSTLAVFLFFPFCPCKATVSEANNAIVLDTTAKVNPLLLPESSNIPVQPTPTRTEDTVKKLSIEKSPNKIKSIFSQFTNFGNQGVDLDEGKKIICFFAPGCDHCQAAAKELCTQSKIKNFPVVYILFMDEEVDKIPDFFTKAGCKFPYKILDIPSFFKLMGDAQTPGINYLWNGHVLKSYDGTGDNKFDAKGLKKACFEKYK